MEAAIIITYKCNAQCQMCNIWKFPTKVQEEIDPEALNKLPTLKFCNVTGGEPFLRDDLEEILYILKKKAKRIVISTNGYFTEKIVNIMCKNKDIGVRISLEGLPAANDELRRLKNGFDKALRTLLELKHLGLKDLGFGITVSDRNAEDMIELFRLAHAMKLEFATAVVHNSYYFHKHDNRIRQKQRVIECFHKLVHELLKTNKMKNWFRAYFNFGLMQYVKGRKRLLPCGAGTDMFFLDPWGEVRPCNGMDTDSKENSFGNLKEKTFDQIWYGQKADSIRKKVAMCKKNCWMIGSASPAMKKHIVKPIVWIMKHKWLKQDFMKNL
jgi:radical SAM protein with 4Fe4S-binding SPASM domain